MRQRAPHPVQLGDDHGVALAQMVEHLVKSRTTRLRAGDSRVGEDALGTGLGQRLLL